MRLRITAMVTSSITVSLLLSISLVLVSELPWYDRARFVVPNSVYEDPENPGAYIQNTNVTTSVGGADFWTDGTRNTGVGENYTPLQVSGNCVRFLSDTMYRLRSSKISVSSSLHTSTSREETFSSGRLRQTFTLTLSFSANGADSNAIGFTIST